MTNKEVKNELIKKYRFLNENIEFILAPYMYEESEEEMLKRCEQYKSTINYPIIKLQLEPIIYQLIEDFLFTSDKLENTLLYIIIEDLKTDDEYLLRVKEGLKILKKKNSNSNYLKENLDLNNIFHKLGRYIDEQSGDLENKQNKLLVLDEYFRLLRYKNDGIIYTSGRELDLHDNPCISKPTRSTKDIGITSNEFITSIVNLPRYEYNKSIFTEEEKQEVYIEIHQDLPYYMEITCDLEDEYIKTMIESRLYRPENTRPCNQTFRIDKKEIFINPDDKLYRYYQLCPYCGYIVNIPKEIIPECIKKEIEERCSEDPFLFRKKYLYSELKSLENQTIQRTLKK